MAKQPERKTLALEYIQDLEDIRIRVRTQPAFITDYAEKIKEGVDLGPIEVVSTKTEDGKIVYIVGDGYHRVAAHRAIERDKITCLVHAGSGKMEKDKAMALEIALDRNSRHGAPMTPADKLRAVRLAIQLLPRTSDTQLAKRCGVSAAFVAGARKGKDKPTSKKKVDVKAHKRTPPAVDGPDDDPVEDRLKTINGWISSGIIDLATVASGVFTKVQTLLLVDKRGQRVTVDDGEGDKVTHEGCTLSREDGVIVIESE